MTSKTKTTADKIGNAKTSHNVKGVWRTVTKNGLAYLKSPDGVRYYGTPAEVSDACLYPFARRKLADTIRLYHYLGRTGVMTSEKAAEIIASRRRDAIQRNGEMRGTTRKHEELSEALRVIVGAAARSEGLTDAEYIRKAVENAIEITRFTKGIAFTRHERAALERDGANATDERATVAA